LSFVELVVTAAPNSCSHIDIAEQRRRRSQFMEQSNLLFGREGCGVGENVTQLLFERATLKLGFGLQALDHTIIKIANQNLSHVTSPSSAIKNDSISIPSLQIQLLCRVSQALESGVIELIDETAMTTAEGNGELIADFHADGARLGKTQMMGSQAAGRR
jgi:hypothetical protein